MDELPYDRMRAALAWQAAIGADEAIGERPRDWRNSARPAIPAPPPIQVAEMPRAAAHPAAFHQAAPRRAVAADAPLGAAAAAEAAAHAAAKAKTLPQLEAALNAFDGCPLKETASRLVFADGTPDGRIMVIGEGPGADEDRIGRPFVGRAGQLLDKMLAAIGLDRTKVYIANIVPWRPPGNRKPSPSEIAVCLPFLERQIILADPRLLILLGQTPTSTLLGRSEGITRLRGQWFEYDRPDLARPALVMPTFHPAYLLRQQSAKKEAWADLQAVQKKMVELGLPATG